jgi:diguanylate cyclase (GGDEF)-like protein
MAVEHRSEGLKHRRCASDHMGSDRMPVPSPTTSRPAGGAGGDHLVVAGLEAIIDATAGILAAQSLEATLQAMADALAPIVPYTSLVVYEVDWTERICVPLLATGSYLEQTRRSRPPLDDSATGSAVLTGELVYRGPDDAVVHVMPGTPVNEVESILVAPLRVGGRVQGTLNLWREALDAEFAEDVLFTPAEMMLTERFASLAAIAYANSSQREQLRTQALTDELTGLYNRRHCEAVLQAVLEDGRRHHRTTSIAYFDIDVFKSINDAFGHAAGDEALRRFAEILRTHTRAGDLVCRTGGEEFTVVLPRTNAAPARRVAERINEAVRAARLGPRADLTVSAGVATAADSLDDFDRLVRRADGALLRAKRAGRDRVVAADAISA